MKILRGRMALALSKSKCHHALSRFFRYTSTSIRSSLRKRLQASLRATYIAEKLQQTTRLLIEWCIILTREETLWMCMPVYTALGSTDAISCWLSRGFFFFFSLSSFDHSSMSSMVCGRGRFRVSGRNNVTRPPTIDKIPKSGPGSHGTASTYTVKQSCMDQRQTIESSKGKQALCCSTACDWLNFEVTLVIFLFTCLSRYTSNL